MCTSMVAVESARWRQMGSSHIRQNHKSGPWNLSLGGDVRHVTRAETMVIVTPLLAKDNNSVNR